MKRRTSCRNQFNTKGLKEMVPNNLERIYFAVVLIIIFVGGLNAQSDSKVSIRGMLKKTAENKYFINDFSIQLPPDKQDSYKFYFDPYVGQVIDFRGGKIGEKLIEGDDVWDSDHPKPTENNYPQIVRSGKKTEDFIPNGWVVLDEVRGDLNNDKLEDAVLAVRGNDLKFFSPTALGPHVDRFQYLTNPISKAIFTGYDGNPRILIVLLNAGNGYKVLLQNNSFLPVSEFPSGGFLDTLKIDNAILTVKFSDADPHWGSANYDYQFQFIKSKLVLVKYDSLIKTRDENKDFRYDFMKQNVSKTIVKKDFSTGKETKSIESQKILLKNLFNLKNLSFYTKFGGTN